MWAPDPDPLGSEEGPCQGQIGICKFDSLNSRALVPERRIGICNFDSLNSRAMLPEEDLEGSGASNRTPGNFEPAPGWLVMFAIREVRAKR